MSPTRIHHIRQQGYFELSDRQIRLLAWGNRTSFIMSTLVLAAGVGLSSIEILALLLICNILGFILPIHPFDWLYNKVLAKRWRRPALPNRSEQIKFAFMLTSIWLLTTIYLFYSEFTLAGYIMGGTLTLNSLLLSAFDLSLSAGIYNYIFLRNQKPFHTK